MRLMNFPPEFPFPKANVKSQRGWTADQHYELLKPRLVILQREFAEQAGEADPSDPRDEIEDSSYYFEPWTEGKVISRGIYSIIDHQFCRGKGYEPQRAGWDSFSSGF